MRFAAAIGALFVGACSPEPAPDDSWSDVIQRLTPLHKKPAKPRPGDWLATRPERGQTFAQYCRATPNRPRGTRNVIYVQPVGRMSDQQAGIVKETARFMSAYFNTETKVLDNLPASLIPADARRSSRGFGVQILTTYVMDEVLRPRLPKDAAAYIAFTALDLYPEPSWNFVFGQASLRHRVGVWSLARNGDPGASLASYRKCLLRTIKTATHETGHMFTMQHCILFECNMGGSMSRAESDRHPLALCPECVAKVGWACKVDLKKRFYQLAALCATFGLTEEEAFYRRSRGVLR